MALLLLRLPSPHQRNPSISFCQKKPSPSPFHLSLPISFPPRCHSRTPNPSFAASSGVSPAAVADDESPAEAREIIEGGERRKRLIAENIPWDCTADDIRALFAKHGAVVDVELSMYNATRNRGLAFVTMDSKEEALEALNNLNLSTLNGRVIKVEFARTLKKQPIVAAASIPKYNVFVGNLTWRVRSRDLRELFGANPDLLSAEVIFQTNPRRSAGYGFVSFSTKEVAEAAINTFNGKKFMGRPIRLVLGKVQADNTGVKSSVAGEEEEGFEVAAEQSNG